MSRNIDCLGVVLFVYLKIDVTLRLIEQVNLLRLQLLTAGRIATFRCDVVVFLQGVNVFGHTRVILFVC